MRGLNSRPWRIKYRYFYKHHALPTELIDRNVFSCWSVPVNFGFARTCCDPLPLLPSPSPSTHLLVRKKISLDGRTTITSHPCCQTHPHHEPYREEKKHIGLHESIPNPGQEFGIVESQPLSTSGVMHPPRKSQVP
jgi:hypothetical protein